jgi:hypothetical protein
MGLFHQLLDFQADSFPFLFQEAGYRPTQRRIADQMGAVGRCRQVATLDLVLPLSAGFDPLQAVCDSEIDGPVIAGFEMKMLVIDG